MAFNQFTPTRGDPEAERSQRLDFIVRAQRMREENKDIPHLIEICIAFGIDRDTFKEEIKKLLSD